MNVGRGEKRCAPPCSGGRPRPAVLSQRTVPATHPEETVRVGETAAVFVGPSLFHPGLQPAQPFRYASTLAPNQRKGGKI